MLGWRVAISAVLIPVLIGVFVLDHRSGEGAPYLLALCVLLCVRGVWEWNRLLDVRSFHSSFRASVACALLVVVAGWAGHLYHLRWPAAAAGAAAEIGPLEAVAMAVTLSVLLLFLRSAYVYFEPGHSMETLGGEMLAVLYVGLLLAVTAQLRWVAGAEAGYLVLASLVIAAKCGDVGAYFLGRFFGKRKMVPRLSPGKTWMGGLGALIASGLAGWAWLQFATPHFGEGWRPPAWYWSVLYGMTIGVVGLVGDLCESLIKRDVGKKDSAPLFPGFGGLLDLIDSILFAGPVAYLLWRCLPLASWL
jgi:phosphatidate cytidylyltransferase